MSVLLFGFNCDLNENRDRPWLLSTNIRGPYVYASFMKYFYVREQDCPHRLFFLQVLNLKSMTEIYRRKKTFVMFPDPKWATPITVCFIFTN